MLHTFSSTAYEIDGNDFDRIKEYKFLAIDNNINYGIKNKNINLADTNIAPLTKNGNIITLPSGSKKVSIVTVPKSTIFYKRTNSDISVTIPESGIYIFDENIEVKTITFNNERYLSLSSISFTYTNTPSATSFDSITNVEVSSKMINNNIITIDTDFTTEDLMPKWNYE
jgi:hypothetical protein